MNRMSLKHRYEEAKHYVADNTVVLLSAKDEINVLKKEITNKNLVIFCGSAISGFPPIDKSTTPPPSGKIFTNVLIDILKQRCQVNNNEVDSFLTKIPFEVLLFLGEEATGRKKILNLLDKLYAGTSYNHAHEILSMLLLQVPVTIITPNYDILIESVFLKNGETVDMFDNIMARNNVLRIYKDGDYNKFSNITTQSIFFKIHGSIECHDSLVYQINHEGVLSNWRKELLKRLIDNKQILFVGYSGTDFDILPELLKLQPGKVYWNDIDAKNLTDEARLLICETKGKMLAGDMRDLLPKLIDNKKECPKEPNVDEEVTKKVIESALDAIFTPLELQHWYGRMLSRLGLGRFGHQILSKINDSSYRKHHMFWRDMAEAFFHDGKYKQSYNYYKIASSLITEEPPEAIRLKVHYLLGASDTLRQQGKLFKQFYLLQWCRFRLWILSILSYPCDQEWASYYTYMAQHPFTFPKQRKLKILKKAELLRREKPMESQLTWISIQTYRLMIDANIKGTDQNEHPLAPTDFDDINILSERIGHPVASINSFRQKAKKLLNMYLKNKTETSFIEQANEAIDRSLSLSRACHDTPGLAKGTLLKAEIKYLYGDYAEALNYYKEAWAIFKDLELSQLYIFWLWFKTYRGRMLSLLKQTIR